MMAFEAIRKILSPLFLASIQLLQVFLYPAHLYAAQNLGPLPEGCMPYSEFAQKFNLNSTSTEKSNPITANLSQTMTRNPIGGLKLLLDADVQVLNGFQKFLPVIQKYAPIFAKNLQAGGRIFFVGCGSSGRAGQEIAAKNASFFPNFATQVVGIMAGGDSVLIRAKEGFEDSVVEGEKALESANLGQNDIVILVSASGSASFNAGCGNFAADKGAKVFYFYNSSIVPERTEALFRRRSNPVIPLELDIGPQAIQGSTRLQAATLAKACLGSLVTSSLYYAEGKSDLAKNFPEKLLLNMKEGLLLIEKELSAIYKFAKMEAEVFSNPHANFRKLKDEGDQGYITFVALEDSLREVLVDAAEMPPTFSTNYMRKETESTKRPEFSAYLAQQNDNNKAWKQALGKDVKESDRADTQNYILAIGADGKNSYKNRPRGVGNVVIAVQKLAPSLQVSSELCRILKEVKAKQGATGFILLSNGAVKEKSRQELRDLKCSSLILENVPHDDLGYSESIVLKQTLNLISTGSMLLMQKVHGNKMIDVNASNMKLINRSMALIQDIWDEYDLTPQLEKEKLYHYVSHVKALKKEFEEQHGVHAPSIVKTVLTMLFLDKAPNKETFDETVKLLSEKNDNLDSILSSGTICIEGGNAKTILQVIDRKGNFLPLFQNNVQTDAIIALGSNINGAGADGVRASFKTLFEGMQIGIKKQTLHDIFSHYKVVAVLSGVKLQQARERVLAIFNEFGLQNEQIRLYADVDCALNLLPSKGIILISGGGSSCFAKDGTKDFRVGGLGTVLGDEGSGHQIGLQAIKRALEDEMGWGEKTALKDPIKSFFNVSDLKQLIPKVNSREILPAHIAKACPFVFEAAEQGDQVAKSIISKAAKDLHYVLEDMIKISHLSNCELHLWGGVFKNKNAESFIEEIDGGLLKQHSIHVVNRSNENAAIALAKRTL